MKLHRTLLAIAASALIAAPAFAAGDDAVIDGVIYVDDLAITTAIVDIDGDFDVTSRSSATVDQDQTTVLNSSVGDGDHAADLTDGALQGASGNIGVNVAAGVGNAQANDAAISAVDTGQAFASAQVFTSQAALGNFGASGFPNSTFYSAVMDGDALRNVSGNVGVNVAAGVGNAQSNAMAASVNSSNRYALSSSDSDQDAFLNELFTNFDLDTFAVLGGDALRGAEGNIGANVAAGVGNLQHNGLTIASGN